MERSFEDYLKEYRFPYKPGQISTEITEISQTARSFHNLAHLKSLFGLLDLTTLNSTDHAARIKELCRKVSQVGTLFSDLPPVAAVCVFPSLVADVRHHLSDQRVHIASVAGGFPHSMTHPALKVMESRLAVADGAQELDVVISVGRFLSGDYAFVFKEIEDIKLSNPGITLKVILETGALGNPDLIYKASWLAMEAGADFIKTSTGKFDPAATPEAVFVMAYAIQHYFKQGGRKVGLKPAGGISTPNEALVYYAIVRKILGEPWLNPVLFRIGASKLANAILGEIHNLEEREGAFSDYF